jgi:hypothetical protein
MLESVADVQSAGTALQTSIDDSNCIQTGIFVVQKGGAYRSKRKRKPKNS